MVLLRGIILKKLNFYRRDIACRGDVACNVSTIDL
jgi:hypothetical protein